jgi:uncharacterized protein
LSDAEQRQWAMFAHLGGILIGFVAPLIIWLMHKERGQYVKEQSREGLNYWITVNAAGIVAAILAVILYRITCTGWFCYGGMGAWSFLPWLVWLAGSVLAVVAGMAANKGQPYRYPVAIRLIK